RTRSRQDLPRGLGRTALADVGPCLAVEGAGRDHREALGEGPGIRLPVAWVEDHALRPVLLRENVTHGFGAGVREALLDPLRRRLIRRQQIVRGVEDDRAELPEPAGWDVRAVEGQGHFLAAVDTEGVVT